MLVIFFIVAACVVLLVLLSFCWYLYKWRHQPSVNIHLQDVESVKEYNTITRAETPVFLRESDGRRQTHTGTQSRRERDHYNTAESEARKGGPQVKEDIDIHHASRARTVDGRERKRKREKEREKERERKVFGDLTNSQPQQPSLLRKSAVFKHIHPTCSSDQVSCQSSKHHNK